MTDKKPKPDDPAEYQRFLDMAREVEAEEDEGALDRAFTKVVHVKPAPRAQSQAKPHKAGRDP